MKALEDEDEGPANGAYMSLLSGAVSDQVVTEPEGEGSPATSGGSEPLFWCWNSGGCASNDPWPLADVWSPFLCGG